MITRKTRIVCISDTHNQTPQLPPGDVLIHAGDLTNQGSYKELKKTVTWLEKAEFEAKIIVAGNHDTTLDAPFFHGNNNKWKWPEPQDAAECRRLLTDSPSITYLENETAIIYLTSPSGPRTRFKIFGSPCSPGGRGWAFQYEEETEAETLWANIENDVDIVVTHTPPLGHRDTARRENRAGCPVLYRRLAETRPMLQVCGHIHEARGAERVRWSAPSPSLSPSVNRTAPSLVESVDPWKDPGTGNKKLSLLDLTAKSGRRLDNTGRLIRQDGSDLLPPDLFDGQAERSQPGAAESNPASALDDAPSSESEAELWRKKTGGAIEYRYRRDVSPNELAAGIEGLELGGNGNIERSETVVINAAILGPRISGKKMIKNKPIVVDIELPVWETPP